MYWFLSLPVSPSQTPFLLFGIVGSELPAKPLPHPSCRPMLSLSLNYIICEITHKKKYASIEAKHIQHSTWNWLAHHLRCVPFWRTSPRNGSAFIYPGALIIDWQQPVESVAHCKCGRGFQKTAAGTIHRGPPWNRRPERPILAATTVYI